MGLDRVVSEVDPRLAGALHAGAYPARGVPLRALGAESFAVVDVRAARLVGPIVAEVSPKRAAAAIQESLW